MVFFKAINILRLCSIGRNDMEEITEWRKLEVEENLERYVNAMIRFLMIRTLWGLWFSISII